MRLLILMLLLPLACQAEVVHREKSLYQDISVIDSADRRCLAFATKRQQLNQSCRFHDSEALVFPYTRMSLAGLLVSPRPERILIVGLGGGTLPTLLADLFPEATLEVVEIDPAVTRVARDYFGFVATPKMTVREMDARVFVKRAGLKGQRFDYVLLDAFNGDYIPEHLMTREFLEEIKALLSDDGVLVANTFSSSRLYHHESVTYDAVFGPYFNLRTAGSTSRVIVAAKGPLPDKTVLKARARDLAEALAPYGVDAAAFPAMMDSRPDWDSSTRPLTDQYSPANLLNH
ncbi:fused MFS/spermidine synthase [Gallaecimonas sp. GXIMD4217]|uniref:spermidine synthase n=1 Tax=Gallaecimonas sp. GXIMD4217 TaxID=3131927 RepID=UPI00311B17D6